LPVAIKLTQYGFWTHSAYSTLIPKDYKIYGSNDGISWTVLVSKTDITYPNGRDYFETINNNTLYSHFALTVNKLKGTGSTLHVNEWFLYGKEIFPDYPYKKEGFIKYVPGLQSDVNLRNTGSWQIADSSVGSVPTATSLALGVVKGGNNISIAGDGTLSVVIPTVYTATSSSLGIVKGGGNVAIADDGTMSVSIPTIPTIPTSLNQLSGNLNQNRIDELYVAINNRFCMTVPSYWNIEYTGTGYRNYYRIPTNLHLNKYGNTAGTHFQYYISLQPNNIPDRHKYYFGVVNFSWKSDYDVSPVGHTSYLEIKADNIDDWAIHTTTSSMGVFYLEVSVFTTTICYELNVILH
jgi:hypothetical protein